MRLAGGGRGRSVTAGGDGVIAWGCPTLRLGGCRARAVSGRGFNDFRILRRRLRAIARRRVRRRGRPRRGGDGRRQGFARGSCADVIPAHGLGVFRLLRRRFARQVHWRGGGERALARRGGSAQTVRAAPLSGANSIFSSTCGAISSRLAGGATGGSASCAGATLEARQRSDAASGSAPRSCQAPATSHLPTARPRTRAAPAPPLPPGGGRGGGAGRRRRSHGSGRVRARF